MIQTVFKLTTNSIELFDVPNYFFYKMVLCTFYIKQRRTEVQQQPIHDPSTGPRATPTRPDTLETTGQRAATCLASLAPNQRSIDSQIWVRIATSERQRLLKTLLFLSNQSNQATSRTMESNAGDGNMGTMSHTILKSKLNALPLFVSGSSFRQIVK
jgi:hypothetical protein